MGPRFFPVGAFFGVFGFGMITSPMSLILGGHVLKRNRPPRPGHTRARGRRSGSDPPWELRRAGQERADPTATLQQGSGITFEIMRDVLQKDEEARQRESATIAGEVDVRGNMLRRLGQASSTTNSGRLEAHHIEEALH